MTNLAETQLAPPPVPTTETPLADQKRQVFRQLSALERALNLSCVVHAQQLQKLTEQFAIERKALKKEIQAVREALEQLGNSTAN